MKKPVLIVGGILLVVILAILAFLASKPQEPQENKNDTLLSPPAYDRGDDDDTSKDTEDNIEKIPPENEPAPPPPPTAQDVQEAVFGAGLQNEYKFFTEPQKKELEDTSISRSEPQPKKEKTYQISWKTDDFSSITNLPETLPVYLLARPLDKTLYDVVKELRDNLGLIGHILRMNEQVYNVVNVKTGEFFLTYDVYHLFVSAPNLHLSGSPVSSGQEVGDTLSHLGLLQFPYSVETFEKEQGDVWYRFRPNLSLPVLSLGNESEEDSSTFTPGKIGVADVHVNDQMITALYSNFPNITEQTTLPTKNVEAVTSFLQEGIFQLGNVELQYPGAIATEDRRKFYDVARGDTVPVSEAELTGFECGYFMEGDSAPQALLSPICLARGKGMVEGYSVLFEVVLPAVSEEN